MEPKLILKLIGRNKRLRLTYRTWKKKKFGGDFAYQTSRLVSKL